MGKGMIVGLMISMMDIFIVRIGGCGLTLWISLTIQQT